MNKYYGVVAVFRAGEAGTVPIRIDFRKTWVSRSPAIILSEISHKPPCLRLHAIRYLSQNTVFQGLCH